MLLKNERWSSLSIRLALRYLIDLTHWDLKNTILTCSCHLKANDEVRSEGCERRRGQETSLTFETWPRGQITPPPLFSLYATRYNSPDHIHTTLATASTFDIRAPRTGRIPGTVTGLTAPADLLQQSIHELITHSNTLVTNSLLKHYILSKVEY